MPVDISIDPSISYDNNLLHHVSTDMNDLLMNVIRLLMIFCIVIIACKHWYISLPPVLIRSTYSDFLHGPGRVRLDYAVILLFIDPMILQHPFSLHLSIRYNDPKVIFCNEYVALRGVSFVKQLIVVIHCINFHLLSSIFIPTSLDTWSPISWFRQSTLLCYLVLRCCFQRLGRCIYCTCLWSGSLIKCPIFPWLWETTVGCFDLMHLVLMPFPIISWIMTEDIRIHGPCDLKSWETFHPSPILFCWSVLSESRIGILDLIFQMRAILSFECLTHITTCWL